VRPHVETERSAGEDPTLGTARTLRCTSAGPKGLTATVGVDTRHQAIGSSTANRRASTPSPALGAGAILLAVPPEASGSRYYLAIRRQKENPP
jgi:hypothetical protein